jgi:hypothetical protein
VKYKRGLGLGTWDLGLDKLGENCFSSRPSRSETLCHARKAGRAEAQLAAQVGQRGELVVHNFGGVEDVGWVTLRGMACYGEICTQLRLGGTTPSRCSLPSTSRQPSPVRPLLGINRPTPFVRCTIHLFGSNPNNMAHWYKRGEPSFSPGPKMDHTLRFKSVYSCLSK